MIVALSFGGTTKCSAVRLIPSPYEDQVEGKAAQHVAYIRPNRLNRELQKLPVHFFLWKCDGGECDGIRGARVIGKDDDAHRRRQSFKLQVFGSCMFLCATEAINDNDL